jgi:hypothetical protein
VAPPRLIAGSGVADGLPAGRIWEPVPGANQLAAVPSLRVAWALWVSMVLARTAGRTMVQLAGALHVAVTLWVVVATGNHFVLDAVAAVPFVVVAVFLVDRRYSQPPLVGSADAFFLHVENAGAPQQVGGMVVLDPVAGGGPTVEDIRTLIRGELDRLPRFRQRLRPGGRWRRLRWEDAEIDWSWHVIDTTIDTAGSAPGPPRDRAVEALERVVAELAGTPLPRDRPLWRLVLVRDPAAGAIGVILLVHHTVADGIGTVVQALHLLRPPVDIGIGERPGPGAAALVLATATGLVQLAAQSRPAGRLPAGSDLRAFGAVALDLETVRAVARRHHARVTDVLLTIVAIALRRTRPDLVERLHGALRVAVPLMVRDPDSPAEGNLTAGVMIDVPLTVPGPADLLAVVAVHNARLHGGTRALASHFVMATALRMLPEPAIGWFARTVYGGRFFHAIVSNMAGPDQSLTLADAPVAQVFPILPPAPGVPLVVGVLSWHGGLGIGLSTDPAVLDVVGFAAVLPDVLSELTVAPRAPVGFGE